MVVLEAFAQRQLVEVLIDTSLRVVAEEDIAGFAQALRVAQLGLRH